MDEVVIHNEIKEASFALILISDTGRITCEYFVEYPDLRLSQLAYATDYEMFKDSLAGYAFCIWEDVFWKIERFRCPDVKKATLLKTYIQNKLNGRS